MIQSNGSRSNDCIRPYIAEISPQNSKTSTRFGIEVLFILITASSIRNNKEIFKTFNFMADKAKFWPRLGLTLDEPSDGILLQEILNYFSPSFSFSCEEIILLLKASPNLVMLNSRVDRRYT